MKGVEFHEKVYDQIISYNSREGEVVTMVRPVMCQGNVEEWLNLLLDEQRESLNEVCFCFVRFKRTLGAPARPPIFR
jgi:hypothetical protein